MYAAYVIHLTSRKGLCSPLVVNPEEKAGDLLLWHGRFSSLGVDCQGILPMGLIVGSKVAYNAERCVVPQIQGLNWLGFDSKLSPRPVTRVVALLRPCTH